MIGDVQNRADLFTMDLYYNFKDVFDSYDPRARACVELGYARYYETFGKVKIKASWYRGQTATKARIFV